ncbi:MAG: nucleotidyl transferase AbiEii/AbiGii toxin family protein [Leptolyngbyaceae cyanobacterium]
MRYSITVPSRLPFLNEICWQVTDVYQLTPLEMLRCYERGWRYRSGPLDATEQQFVDRLVQQYGSWLSHMFTQDQHQKILTVLSQLKASFLRDCQVYFGGGTLLALMYDEYRLSKDIDFLCSNQAGYQQLRNAVFEQQYQALFKDSDQIGLPREIQTNQYGIRFPVVVGNSTIRFEIISEGRVTLAQPEQPPWCPVACLSAVDRIAEKLLANSDRWPDRSVFSRDLIDLSMVRSHQPIPTAALAKAEAAYGVAEPLQRAILEFQQRPDYRDRCYDALSIHDPPRIIDGLDQLASDFDLAPTHRSDRERAGVHGS